MPVTIVVQGTIALEKLPCVRHDMLRAYRDIHDMCHEMCSETEYKMRTNPNVLIDKLSTPPFAELAYDNLSSMQQILTLIQIVLIVIVVLLLSPKSRCPSAA